MRKTRLVFGLLALIAVCAASALPAVHDFDGDGKTDPTTIQRVDEKLVWQVSGSRAGHAAIIWGESESGVEPVRVPADYDGDGKADAAIWRRPFVNEGQSYLYILYSGTNTFSVTAWGRSFDSSIAQDYDGDGKADFAVARSSNSGLTWYILQSRDGIRIERFGLGGDQPVTGDYDGDGIGDLAVYRRDVLTFRADYIFYIKRSSDGAVVGERFGYAQADIVAPGDYDGDGKTDIAVWRGRSEYGNGVWYWKRSSDGAVDQVQWGTQEPIDTNVQGDYDGDGKTDPAVWRANGVGQQSYYYINQSRDGFLAFQWGRGGNDSPLQPF